MPCTVYLFVMHTVNVFIFAGGKFRDCFTRILREVANFAIKTNLPSYFCYFVISAWGNFRDKSKIAKNAKFTPRQNFNIDSIHVHVPLNPNPTKTPPSNTLGLFAQSAIPV